MAKNNDVKGTVIKYGGKSIVVTKDIMQTLTGIGLIILSFILSGFFAFVSVGFDPSRLATGSFWLSYFITLGTMYLGFFGVYVIREGRNKRQPKIVINNQARRDFRNSIISNRKLESCENWLKIYNYAKRVEIHKDNLTEAYRKLGSVAKPNESLDHNSRKYKKQLKKHNAYIEKKKYIKEQLEFANIHSDIVKKLKNNDINGANELKKKLTEEDSFKRAKISWREIYFNDLFNGSMRTDSNSIFYNKSKAVWDNIKFTLLLSFCSTMITTSMLLSGNEVSVFTIITIISNIAMLICYAVMAIRVADNVVFETIYPADENKLLVCNLFKEDDERNGAKWVDIEELEEKEESKDGATNEEVVESEEDNT